MEFGTIVEASYATDVHRQSICFYNWSTADTYLIFVAETNSILNENEN